MGKNLKVNESIIDLIEKGEKYREGLKNDYTTNRVDEEFRKEYDAVKLEMDIIRENEDDSTKQNNVNKE